MKDVSMINSKEIDLEAITFAELEADPYPLYAQIDASGTGVSYVPAAGGWLLTGFELVRDVLQDNETFAASTPTEPLEVLGENAILSLDGPRHLRYRKGLHAVMSRPAVHKYSDAVIVDVIARQLELIEGRSSLELVSEFFEPISVLTLGRIMGVPEIDASTLRRWFYGIILGSSNVMNDMDIAREAHGISREIDTRMAEVFERLDREPNQTIVSHLLQAAAGETLDDRIRDIRPTLKVVIGGGLQEPGHGASTMTAAILSDEAVRQRFLADPAGLSKQGVEEAIRWVSPIQVNSRLTTRDVELDGFSISKGTYVNVSIAAANRSTQTFGEDAAVYDLDRGATNHLAFGSGSHHCSGNNLGRVSMRLAVQMLFEKYPNMKLAENEEEVPFQGFVFRAPRELNVSLN